MFFKSKVGRDIDRFKAMQDKASHVAKSVDRSGQQGVSTSSWSAGQPAPKLDDQTIERNVQEPVNGAIERQQSMVGANATWEGKIRTEGSARIEGEMSGEVEAGDTVFVERGARVRANIHARRVIIGGDAEGQIICREQLVVEHSGRLGGEVSTRTLVIEEGAVVHSRIQMLRDEEPVRARAKSTNAPVRQDAVALGAIEANQGLKAGQIRESGSIAVEIGREE